MLCVGVGGSRRADQSSWAADYQWHKDGVWVDQADGHTAPGLQAGNTNSAAHAALWGTRILGSCHRMFIHTVHLKSVRPA